MAAYSAIRIPEVWDVIVLAVTRYKLMSHPGSYVLASFSVEPLELETSSSPLTIQSRLFPEWAFSFSRKSSVGALWPFSYFDSWVWPTPISFPN